MESGMSARLDRLAQAGIDYYVDYRRLLPANAEYSRFAIADQSVPLNISQTQAVLASIRTALARERRVYLHCRAGIGRTGLIAGCFLADEENDGRRAIKSLNRLWQQSAQAPHWPHIPQTSEQTDYIRRWPKLRDKRV